MIKTTDMILDELSEYSAPANKLIRMVKAGTYIPIVRGLYETDPSVPGCYLAGSIYGPSYLSFEFALSRYGLIPEAVYTFTSATYDKKKKKEYHNAFGTYTYRDIPPGAYPAGVLILTEGKYAYQIASAEKAFCDQLYKMPPVHNLGDLRDMIFEDIRMDEEEVASLDKQMIDRIAPLYKCSNLKLVSRLMRKMS
ncbi:MAG: hypothetical protein PHX95_10665 [Lachnospiraceae bacterium]|nr:hypothetical protein [Lachnospiraceae bacterium]